MHLKANAIGIAILLIAGCDSALEVTTSNNNVNTCKDGAKGSSCPHFKDATTQFIEGNADRFINADEVLNDKEAIANIAGQSRSYTDWFPLKAAPECDATLDYGHSRSPSFKNPLKADGAYILCIAVTGDTGEKTYFKSPIIHKDTVAPSVEKIGTITATGEISLAPKVDDSDLESIKWQMTSGPGDMVFSAPDKVATDVKAIEAGTYTIELIVTDRAGNSAKQSFEFNWQPASDASFSTPPISVSFSSDASINVENNKSYPLSGSCVGEGEEVRLGGALDTKASCLGGSWSKTVDFSSLKDGEVTVTATIGDGIHDSIALLKDVQVPLGASSLSWADTSPLTTGIKVTSIWTRGASPDIAAQIVRYFNDSGCTAQSGADVLKDKSATSDSHTGANNSSIWF